MNVVDEIQRMLDARLDFENGVTEAWNASSPETKAQVWKLDWRDVPRVKLRDGSEQEWRDGVWHLRDRPWDGWRE